MHGAGARKSCVMGVRRRGTRANAFMRTKNAPRRARHKRVRPSRMRLGSPRHARTLANSRYCSAPNGEERSPHFDYSLLASLIEVLVRTAKTRRPLCVHFLAKVLRRLEVVVSRRRAPGLLTLEPQ